MKCPHDRYAAGDGEENKGSEKTEKRTKTRKTK